jgi:ADP-ribose pyrophosphatase YjhB (NUDIX family)
LAKDFPIKKLLYRVLCAYWWVVRPTSLGSCLLVVKNDSVLLVRMTYVNGWHFPGGGVKRGESFYDAGRRELREECGLEAAELTLLQLFYSRTRRKHDHVALYLIRSFSELPNPRPSPEISEVRFFPLDQLPAEASGSVVKRIKEYRKGTGYATVW